MLENDQHYSTNAEYSTYLPPTAQSLLPKTSFFYISQTLVPEIGII